MARLSGRHALVTGGGRGIGRAVAAALSAAGATVTVVGRHQAALDDAVSAGHAAGVIAADVTDPTAIDAGIRQAEAARGPFDILVANAGAVGLVVAEVRISVTVGIDDAAASLGGVAESVTVGVGVAEVIDTVSV